MFGWSRLPFARVRAQPIVIPFVIDRFLFPIPPPRLRSRQIQRRSRRVRRSVDGNSSSRQMMVKENCVLHERLEFCPEDLRLTWLARTDENHRTKSCPPP
jgi:hypothetical protein